MLDKKISYFPMRLMGDHGEKKSKVFMWPMALGFTLLISDKR
jgi:hypothetical protein